MKKLLTTLTLSSIVLSQSSLAEGVDFSGSVDFEVRGFTDSAPYAFQRNGSGLSVALNPEFYYESESGDDSITFKPYLRIDPSDDQRNHADIRELKWLRSGDDWELVAGIDKVFWGVAESNHLVDIINQTDAVDNPNMEEKLGQAMVQYALLKDWGTLRFFALPQFRERTFPGKNGRLRSALPVDDAQAVYESGAGENRMDLALRYEHTVGDWDIGLAHFNGTSREARLTAGLKAVGENVFIPHYDVINQSSVDVQYTTDAWLWKLEALTRSGQGDRFAAAVGGFEYTFYGIQDTDADLGLLLEYHYDERSVNAPTTLFDDDVFTAVRYVLNDAEDTELLAGVLFDAETRERMFNVEASRRLNDQWTAELEGTFFSGDSSLKTEDFILMRLSRHF
jgi:hypothetical protein